MEYFLNIFMGTGLLRFVVWLSGSGRDAGLSDKEDQRQDGHHIRDHGDQVHRDRATGAEDHAQTVAEAEKDAAPHRALR